LLHSSNRTFRRSCISVFAVTLLLIKLRNELYNERRETHLKMELRLGELAGSASRINTRAHDFS